jgi:hypothetical protein
VPSLLGCPVELANLKHRREDERSGADEESQIGEAERAEQFSLRIRPG